MTTSYLYSIDTHFTNGLRNDQLKTEILSEPGIAPAVLDVASVEDVVTIVFASALSGPELALLNNVIAAHVPAVPSTSVLTFAVVAPATVDPIWTTVHTIQFPGTPFMTTIESVRAHSYMDPGGTSFQVRVADVTHSTVLASATFTNTVGVTNDLGLVSNVPIESSDVEIQCKVAGATSAYIDSAIVYFS